MKTWSLATALLLLTIAPSARADLAPPVPKEPTYPLVVEAGPKVQEARLIIPQKMLGKLKSSLDEEGGDAYGAAGGRMHTIIAGAALALALTFGGLWLVRRGPTGGSRNLAMLISAVAFLSIGAAVWADRRPAPKPEVPRTDKVLIEITDKGDEIKLIVNKAKLAKLLEEKK